MVSEVGETGKRSVRGGAEPSHLSCLIVKGDSSGARADPFALYFARPMKLCCSCHDHC